MNRSLSFKSFVVIAVFALAALGCDLFSPATPQPLPTATTAPTVLVQPTTFVQTNGPANHTVQPPTQLPSQLPTQPPTSGSSTLSSAKKQQLAHATVRISLLQKINGKLQTIGTGSGTIISPDGLILTNCHVADPSLVGDTEDQPDELGVEIVDSEDQPPVPSYFARVMAADGTLDLAVIKIDRKLDGTPVKTSSLNLPYVTIGDSDKVEFGDPIYIFGFPGIGGDTITYTSGSVSGFDSMDPLGTRAWIKTDATIAGGNSGGLAVNTDGEIIGVPTRLGTSSAAEMTDCRVIADTNGDGVIDNKDACVPTGGFINAIRPVKWAMKIIQAVQSNTAYVSPYGQPATKPVSSNPSASSESFTINGWSATVDKNQCPVQPVQSFPSGVKKIYAVFDYKNMTSGEKWNRTWLYNQRQVIAKDDTWSFEQTGSCLSLSLSNGNNALPDGTYEVQIYAGDNLALAGSAQVEVGGKGSQGPTENGSVSVTGKVIDANTGDGLADMYVVVLKPGISPDDWKQNGTDADIYSYTQTDSQGRFTLPDALPRGTSYGLVVGNSDSNYQSFTGSLDVTNSSPNPMSLTIQLNQ